MIFPSTLLLTVEQGDACGGETVLIRKIRMMFLLSRQIGISGFFCRLEDA